MSTKEQALTWSDLADLYDKHHSGRKARTLPMDQVADWAESRTDLIRIGDDDCFYLVGHPS